MVSGVHLTLMIGTPVPLPVPREVLEALASLQVTSAAGDHSGFQLTFTLSKQSPLHTLFLLAGPSPIPLVRVLIVAIINGIPHVLMDGVMSNHEATSGSDSGQATLSVTGEDMSRVMDFADRSGKPYPGMPREARVLEILARYMALGVVPAVIPSAFMDVPIPTEHIPQHQGTDLQYLRALASEVGYVFYVEPGPAPGVSTAYWGPEVKVGVPQPALNVDMDAQTNVESLSFSYNADSRTLPVVFIQNKQTKAPLAVPIPDVSPLSPPLGLVSPAPKAVKLMRDTAKLSAVQALMLGMAEAARTSEAVTASGSLDVLRYGRALRAGGLVGVRGAGMAFDGLYYVKSVTHTIKRGEYKQSFSLSRNGLVSTIPRVTP